MIEFCNIVKCYGKKKIINNVDLKIEEGELVAIIGESGCGKTTMLKMVNALIKPTSGKIFVDGQNIVNKKVNLKEISKKIKKSNGSSKDKFQLFKNMIKPDKENKVNLIEFRRNIGYVVQSTGLFPHMTIKQNIELIPKLEKVKKEDIAERTMELMKIVGLKPEDFLQRYPAELSGGQQQRIGVARAFALNPKIILMDEPFSALDPMTRSDLQDELLHIQSEFHKTIVFVTHDMDEAVKIADKICIMNKGQILQYDTPENILKNPVDDYVESFVGKNRIWSSPEMIKISDIMISSPAKTSPNIKLMNALEKMRSKKVDTLMVTDSSGKYLGYIRAKDCRKAENKNELVKTLIRNKYPTIKPECSIIDALEIAKTMKHSTIPVVDENGTLNGLVTKSSLVTTLSQQFIDFDDDDDDILTFGNNAENINNVGGEK